MTDDTQNDTQSAKEIPAVAAVAGDDPMAKAIEGGYVEPTPPSRDERVSALIADVEHAMAHNAPMTPAILTEMKALLQG